MGRVDCGEDDPVGEKAAGNVIKVCPAGAEFVALDFKIIGETIVDFADGVAGRVLDVLIEPEPLTHDLVPGLFGHTEKSWAFHIGEPYVLEVLVSESHRVKPYVEVEEKNAVYFRGAFVCRCVEYQLHSISKGLVYGEGLLIGVVSDVQLVLVGCEMWHANVRLSKEGFVTHHRRYPFREIFSDSNEGHAVLERRHQFGHS